MARRIKREPLQVESQQSNDLPPNKFESRVRDDSDLLNPTGLYPAPPDIAISHKGRRQFVALKALPTPLVDGREEFRRKLLANPRTREQFDSLCIKCSADDLVRILFSVCAFAVADLKPTWKRLTGFSDHEIERLSCNINDLADRIERANAVFSLGPAHFLAMMENPNALQEGAPYKIRAEIYLALPTVLRKYGKEFRSYAAWTRKAFGPKRLDPLRFAIIQLIAYVEGCTGKPHYSSLACLLQRGFYSLSGHEDRIPKVLTSVDALQRLYTRNPQFRVVRITPPPAR